MLSARAYSFRQKSRLAISLSWIGGYTNVITLLACGAATSHVTGHVTGFGRAGLEGQWLQVRYFALLLVAFLVGAAASALMIEGARLRGTRSKYILPLGLEAVLLGAVAWGLTRYDLRAHEHAEQPWSHLSLYWITTIASLAMGLQNAAITKISGAEIRTTHLTGVLTDLGLESVQYLYWALGRTRGRRWARAGRVLRVSQRHPTALRLALLASILGSFLFGVVAGAWAFETRGGVALALPIAFLCWIIWVDWRSPIADVRELDLLSDPELKAHGILKELLPPRLGIYRLSGPHGHPHKAPNFAVWVERIPRRWEVVILAISPMTRFTPNALLDLQAAAAFLHGQNRRLIVSGVTPHQFKELDALGVAEVLDADNLCPDLEFAIARAMTLAAEPPAANGERRVTPAV